MMTKGRVDLSKATKMPKFTKELPSNVRVLRSCPLRLECAVSPSIQGGSNILFCFLSNAIQNRTSLNKERHLGPRNIRTGHSFWIRTAGPEKERN